MVDSQPLAKLRDIHLPEPISWWPMAPGWYLILSLAIISMLVLFYFLRRRFMNGRAKFQALCLLAIYYEEYQREGNSQVSCMKVSELLRRVALVYFPREQVASLQGEPWLAFLTNSANDIDFYAFRDCLLEFPYKQPTKEKDLHAFFNSAKAWIKQRGEPCLN